MEINSNKLLLYISVFFLTYITMHNYCEIDNRETKIRGFFDCIMKRICIRVLWNARYYRFVCLCVCVGREGVCLRVCVCGCVCVCVCVGRWVGGVGERGR